LNISALANSIKRPEKLCQRLWRNRPSLGLKSQDWAI